MFRRMVILCSVEW